MIKRGRRKYFFLLFCLVAIVFSFGFVISVTYNSPSDFCKSQVTESSTFGGSQDCVNVGVDDWGGNITVGNIILNCNSFLLSGSTSNTGFGVKINNTATNVSIKSCIVKQFDFDLNVSGNNATVIDSDLTTDNTGTTAQAWFGQGLNTTFLNVSFTRTMLAFDNPASAPQTRLWVQYYLRVRVNDTAGNNVNGATVYVYNESGVASDLSATWKSSEATSNRDAKHIGEVLVGNAA